MWERSPTAGLVQLAFGVTFIVSLMLWAAPARGSGERSIVVVASAEHGPTVTQFFRAVVQARLPDVEVSFVPDSQWINGHTRGAGPTLLFRLDTSSRSEWRLRLVYRGQAWQRSIEGGLEKDAAAIEAAALIAARTSVALLTVPDAEEQAEELEAWAVEPRASAGVTKPAPMPSPRAPASATAPPERGALAGSPGSPGGGAFQLELLAGYRGSTYATEQPWSHGFGVALEVRMKLGPCASVGYAYLAQSRVESEFGSFEIERHQAELLLGWCFRFGRLSFSPKLGALLEPTRRTATHPALGVGDSPDDRSVGAAGVTAFRLEWGMLSSLGVYASLGALYLLQDQEFVAAGVSEPLLAPHRVRLTLDLGLAARLF